MKLSVVTSNSCWVLQMVRLTVTFPDRCRIKRASKINGGPPQDQVASGSLSPRQIHQARSGSVSRGVCLLGAPDYGKVIHLDVLHPPPPTFGSLHWDDCQSCVCPCSTAFRSALRCCKWDTVEARILIRWLATVSSRRSASSTVSVYFPVLYVCAWMSAGTAANPSPARRRDGLYPAWEDYIIGIITVLQWHCLWQYFVWDKKKGGWGGRC